VAHPCGCGDDFCGSFYTIPKALLVDRKVTNTLSIMIADRMVYVDMDGDDIRYVEVLEGSDIRQRLLDAFPGPAADQ